MNNFVQRTITSIVLFVGLITLIFYLPPIFLSISIVAAFVLIFIYEWPLLMPATHEVLPITFFYLCIPFYCLISLVYFSSKLFFLLICFVAIFDTGAYLFGKLVGRHKIVPTISPGKSWEGLFGGLFAVWATLAYLACQSTHHVTIVTLACTISGLALLGDLFESWLKRKACVKNSGTLLPGHGGILDRIDGLLPVSVFFFIFKNQLLSIFCL